MSAIRVWLAGLPSTPVFRMILAAPILCYIGWHTMAYLKKNYNVNNNGDNGSNGAANGSSLPPSSNGNGNGAWRGKPYYQVKRAREMEGPIYRVLGYDFWSPRTSFLTPILIYMRKVVRDTL